MNTKPTLLKIERAHSIEEIEEYSRVLSDPAASMNLMVPTNIKDAHLGAVGSLIQVIATWSQRCSEGNLLIYSNEGAKIVPALSNLALTQHGLVALLVAAAVRTNHKDYSVDCTEEARSVTFETLSGMSQSHLGFRSGSELLLIAADGTIYETPPQLYTNSQNGYPLVQTYTDFLNLASEMIEKMSSVYSRSLPLGTVLTQHLTTLLYELFKNTHMWARHHIDNVPIRRSVRGVRVEFSRYEDLNIDALSPWHRAYLRTISPREMPQDFIELAVFDSGPGLAARMMGRDISSVDTLDGEYASVMKCLALHATTSRKSHHGVGLAEVMNAISDANGFVRVRSGRLALYRDFSSSDKAFHNDFYLNDWRTGGDLITDHGSLEGTLVSVVLPVMRKHATNA